MVWKGRKVLVTGAGGFIGSHLVEALVGRGAEVRALVRYNSRNNWGHIESLPGDVRDAIDVRSGDIRDPFLVDGVVEGTDIVFHLSSLIAIPYSYQAPHSYAETNINGALNVLQACRRHEISRLVHTSTSETYGTAIYTPIDEGHPLQAQSPYAASKIGADKLAESFHRSFGLPVAIIRPFNTFGPRQSARAVIPTIVSQALTQRRVQLGSVSPTRDLTFVTDTVEGFLRVAEAEACIGEVVNIGNGKGITVGELAQLIVGLTGRDVAIESAAERIRPDRSEVQTLICDARKASRLLGWEPKVGLREGLLQVIEWVRTHAGDFKAGVYNV